MWLKLQIVYKISRREGQFKRHDVCSFVYCTISLTNRNKLQR